MQDNAPIHKTKAVTEYLNEHKVDVLPWPAFSSDLNPIENIWAEMQKQVYKRMRLGVRLRDEVCEKTRIEKLHRSMENQI